ncbi:hypothetical protein BX661DRAFT_181058, partial [Kickxella alabastrina]|uniref:uncharacterized protein n=1 Tax=Kickxella alabastrina TaxID=61397 RepID=UPI00222083EF
MGKSGRSSGRRKNGQPTSAKRSHREHQHQDFSELGTAECGCAIPPSDVASAQSQMYLAAPASPSAEQWAQQRNSMSRPRGSDQRLYDLLCTHGASEGDNNSQRQKSSGSQGSRSKGSNEHNLASVISHYMGGMDSDSTTDLLASRYYGNMDHMGTADRLPRPMNSTLPLFSPSVPIDEEPAMRPLAPAQPVQSAAELHDANFPELPCNAVAEASDADGAGGRAGGSASKAPLAAIDAGDTSLGLGMQLDERPASQVRTRRPPNMGATQYTPAAATKKAALARGAPGISYMFSPSLGSSRPSSVAGINTSPHTPSQKVVPTHLADITESAMAETPGASQAAGEHQSDTEPARAPRTRAYGSINIEALEQFLDEGEIPDSTSEDESSDDGFGWAADSSATTGSPSTQSCSDQSTFPSSRSNICLSPSSVADERAPLLEHTAINISTLQLVSEAGNFAMPANVPNRSAPQLGSHAHPAQKTPTHRKKSYTRGKQRRRHHEELFLDQDGFIDESYRFTFFNPAVGTIRAQEFADMRTPAMDLSALLQVGGCFWIDVLRPSFQEMHLISKIFGIHTLTVEDIMTQDMREKCETHANYYFVCFRSFDNDPHSESYLAPKCVYNIVLREGIITFHMDPSVHQYHVLRRIRRQIDHIVVTPDWLNYAIIDDITDLVAPILQLIEFDVDAIDELVLVISSTEQSDMLLRISTARKRIMMALRLLQGKADVVRALIKRFETATAMSTNQFQAIASLADRPFQRPIIAVPEGTAIEMALDQRKGQETLLYLGDVLDHIVTMTQNAAHYDNILGARMLTTWRRSRS